MYIIQPQCWCCYRSNTWGVVFVFCAHQFICVRIVWRTIECRNHKNSNKSLSNSIEIISNLVCRFKFKRNFQIDANKKWRNLFLHATGYIERLKSKSHFYGRSEKGMNSNVISFRLTLLNWKYLFCHFC